MIKLAFSKPTFDEEDTRFLFTRYRDMGYDGLQLKAGQYMPYLDSPARFLEAWGPYPGAASALIVGGTLDADGLSRLRAIFGFARAVATECVVFCHTTPREGLDADEIRAFARSLSELGKEAQDYGLRLSLHHHHGQPVMHRADFDLFFDAVPHDAVGLTVDTAHLVKSGVTDIAGLIRDFHHVIDNFHLKDIEDGEFRVLGTATIDFAPVFTAICDIGYAGWVSADEESGADLAQAMEHCLAFMTTGLDMD